MAYGGQILRSDGTYWLTPDQPPLNMVKRQDINYTATGNIVYFDTGVAASRPCAVFSRITNTGADQNNAGGYLIKRNNTWQFQLNGVQGSITIRWYVFSDYVVAPGAYDIQYYNSAGVATWNGSSRPLQLYRLSVSSANTTDVGTILNVGETCAIIPTFSGTNVEGLLPGTPPIYLIGTYCYKAVGNTLKVDLCEVKEDPSGDGYVPYEVGTCFYIKTKLYDY
ncbi:hypothetical protein [Kluyvera intermedia]|uniref:hypothetical protein n=1 Tax=Kluyvera intermedia TaxID=61648 RepID=UPI00370CA6D0